VTEPVRKVASRFGCLIPLGTALLLLVILPFGFFSFVFWAADGSWDFERRDKVRYWVLVSGSRLEQLGFVAPEQTPSPRYSVSLQDGNFPGWKVLTYRSAATPDAIVEVYAKRCQDMGLKITRGPEPKIDGKDSGVSLVCEIRPYIDAEVHAERKPGETTTEVGVRVWGDD
jgi:hypothetical protein